MIGKKLSPILEEIEDTLWEFEAHIGTKPEYTDLAFRACVKIMMSALMDKIWELQEKEKMPIKYRLEMVEKAGNDLSKLIKTYADIDTKEVYN